MNKKLLLVLVLAFHFSSAAHANICERLFTNSKHFKSVEEYSAFFVKFVWSRQPVSKLFTSVEIDYQASDSTAVVGRFVDFLELHSKAGLKELIFKDTSYVGEETFGPALFAELVKRPTILKNIESFRLNLAVGEAQYLTLIDLMPNLQRLDLGITEYSTEFFNQLSTRIATRRTKIAEIKFGILNVKAENFRELLPVKDFLLGMSFSGITLDSDVLNVLKDFTKITSLVVDAGTMAIYDRNRNSDEPKKIEQLIEAFPQLEHLAVDRYKALLSGEEFSLSVQDLPILLNFKSLKSFRVSVAASEVGSYQNLLVQTFKDRSEVKFEVVQKNFE